MTSLKVPQSLRQLVRARARGRCEYCHSSERITGLQCEIDHIIPRAKDGTTTADNLCLACSSCNGYKQVQTHAIDPMSGKKVALFNPRQQRWHDHFTWSEDGTKIEGMTACGRSTVLALKLNHSLAIVARSIWVSTGLHPPAS